MRTWRCFKKSSQKSKRNKQKQNSSSKQQTKTKTKKNDKSQSTETTKSHQLKEDAIVTKCQHNHNTKKDVKTKKDPLRDTNKTKGYHLKPAKKTKDHLLDDNTDEVGVSRILRARQIEFMRRKLDSPLTDYLRRHRGSSYTIGLHQCSHQSRHVLHECGSAH